VLEWRGYYEYEVDHYGSRYRTLALGPHIYIELGSAAMLDPKEMPNPGFTKSWTIQSVDTDDKKDERLKYIRFDSVCYEAAYPEDVDAVLARLHQRVDEYRTL
jgi:hypothetical protein